MANHHEDEENAEGPRGFAAVPLAELLAHAAHDHDRQHMMAEAAELSIYHLLDSLNIDQLVALRRMFNADTDSASNQYFDGQIVTVLRLKHRVNGGGRPFMDAAALVEKIKDDGAGT